MFRAVSWNCYTEEYDICTAEKPLPKLAPGHGFWLIHVNPEAKSIDIEGAPVNPSESYYEVKFLEDTNSLMFHIAGNPYPYPVKWKECRVKVPVGADPMVAKPARIALEDIRSWQINLGVQSADGSARDTYNRAGVILTEGAESRLLNAAELLPPGEHITLALKDPADTEREALAYDYREAGKSEYTWEVELSTTYPSVDARLSLTGLAEIPKGYMLTLKDAVTGEVYALDGDKILPVTLLSGASQKFLLTATAKSTGAAQEKPVVFGITGINPNPFNPSTSITFGLEQAGQVRVKVYSLTGQLTDTLVDTRLSAGSHTVTWNPKGLASGVYFISVESNGKRDSCKATLMK
ncbi:MAG: T9SS type A sorting domain-containing protein [Candidatus Latescibacterota bacterium]